MLGLNVVQAVIYFPIACLLFFDAVQSAQQVQHPAATGPIVTWRLERAHSVSFVARISHDSGDERDRLSQGQRFQVKASRPASLRVEDISTPMDFTSDKPVVLMRYNVFITNGKRQLELARGSREYYEDESATTLERLQSRSELLECISPDILFDSRPLHNFQFSGSETVNAHGLVTFVRIVPFERRKVKYVLSVETTSGLPSRISMFLTNETGHFIEIWRTDYSDWVIDPDIPASEFDPTPPPDSKPVAPEPVAYDPKLEVGSFPAPLRGRDTRGRLITLQAHKGKVVLLDYWATWCGPCLEEMPIIKGLYKRYHSRGFEIIGISLDDSARRHTISKFVADNRIVWPQLCDGKGFRGPLAAAYHLQAIPFTLLVGRDGKIKAINLRGKELEKAIQHAL